MEAISKPSSSCAICTYVIIGGSSFAIQQVKTYLVTHGEAAVVRRRSPEVGNKAHIREVDQVEPTVQHEPTGLPVSRSKVRIAGAGEGKRVEEKEAEDDKDAAKNAPPESLVHEELDALLAVDKVLHREVQRVKSPNVEGRESCRERQNNQEDQRTSIIRADRQRSNGIDDTKDEVGHSEPADPDHGLTERVLDHTVTHTNNKKQKERE